MPATSVTGIPSVPQGLPLSDKYEIVLVLKPGVDLQTISHRAAFLASVIIDADGNVLKNRSVDNAPPKIPKPEILRKYRSIDDASEKEAERAVEDK